MAKNRMNSLVHVIVGVRRQLGREIQRIDGPLSDTNRSVDDERVAT